MKSIRIAGLADTSDENLRWRLFLTVCKGLIERLVSTRAIDKSRPTLAGRLNGTARARSSRLRGGEPYQDRNRKGHARCQRHPVFLVQPQVHFHFHFQLLRPTR